jgi:hypothetical protein
LSFELSFAVNLEPDRLMRERINLVAIRRKPLHEASLGAASLTLPQAHVYSLVFRCRKPGGGRSNHELAITTLVCGNAAVAAVSMRWSWVNQAVSE